MRTSHAVIAFLLAAAGAHAQSCTDISLSGIPDFDMRRSVDCPIGTAWLPGAGRAYSAPTATMNLIAYLANNGVPSATTPPGPQEWMSNTLYNDVTAMIAELGLAMQTDPEDGTPASQFNAGIQTYFTHHGAGGGFHVTTFARSAHEDGFDILAHTADIMHSGGLATLGVAWMSYSPPNDQYTLQGRHVVSVVGVSDACTTFPRVAVHDPATTDSECEQGGLVDTFSNCQFINANFDFGVHINFTGRHRLNSFQGPFDAFIDGARGFFPPSLIAPCEPGLPCLRLYRPYWWLQNPGGPVQDFDLPIFAPIHHLALAPDMTSVFITTPRVNLPPTLYRFSIPTGEVETLSALMGTPTAMAVDRFGDIFLIFRDRLRRYQVIDGRAVEQAARDSDFAADAFVYDDVTDELVGVLAEQRMLVRWSRDLTEETPMKLPSDVDLPGDGLIALHPQDNRVWVMGTSASSAFEIIPAQPGAPARAARVDLEGLSEPTAFALDPTGRMFVAQNGLMHVFVKVPGVVPWQIDPESPFEDRPIGSVFSIPRSRDNYTGAARETMDLDFAPPLTPLPTPCPADFNLDSTVTSQDFFDFLSAFFAGAPSAEFNNDDLLNSQDFFDFLSAFLKGC